MEELRSKLIVYQTREQDEVLEPSSKLEEGVGDMMETESLGGGEGEGEECGGDRWE